VNNETAGALVPAQILYDAFHGRFNNSAGAIVFLCIIWVSYFFCGLSVTTSAARVVSISLSLSLSLSLSALVGVDDRMIGTIEFGLVFTTPVHATQKHWHVSKNGYMSLSCPI